MSILKKYNSNVVLDLRLEKGSIKDFSSNNTRVVSTTGTRNLVQNGYFNRSGDGRLEDATAVKIKEKTIIAIFSIEQAQTSTSVIFGLESANWYVGVTATDEYILSYQIAAGTQVTETTGTNSPIYTNGKDNICITSMDVSGDNVRVFHYINGKLEKDSTRATGVLEATGTTGYLMSYNGAGSYTYGTLKRLVVLNTALTDSEAEQLYTELKKRTLNRNNVERLNEAGENLFKYSETFENAYWTKARSTADDNTIIAPNNTTTACTLSEDDTAGDSHYLSINPYNTNDNLWYTVSVYAKAINRNWIKLFHATSGVKPQASFNLSTGTVGTVTGPSEVLAGIDEAENGFYRCWLSWRSNYATTNSFVVAIADADDSINFDGLDQNSVAIWGFQTELRKGSPSKYKKTNSIARNGGIISDYYVGNGEGWNTSIDISTGGADDGALTNTGWTGYTGEEHFVYDEIVDDKNFKFLYGDGVNEKAYKINNNAYGSWEFKMNYTTQIAQFAFISTMEDPTNAAAGSYFVQWATADYITVWKKAAGGATTTLFVSDTGLLTEDHIYTYLITRDENGVFTFYIKGNEYGNEYTKIPPATGHTNPVTDTTTTTSDYVASRNSGTTEIVSNHLGGFNFKPYDV